MVQNDLESNFVGLKKIRDERKCLSLISVFLQQKNEERKYERERERKKERKKERKDRMK